MTERNLTSPLDRALSATATLKPGDWSSVAALALLAVEAKGHPECASLQRAAHSAAEGLKAGTWESVRTLSLLARADRILATD